MSIKDRHAKLAYDAIAQHRVIKYKPAKTLDSDSVRFFISNDLESNPRNDSSGFITNGFQKKNDLFQDDKTNLSERSRLVITPKQIVSESLQDIYKK